MNPLLTLPLVSYATGALTFLVLTVLVLRTWKGHAEGGLLLLASAVTTLWLAALTWDAAYGGLHASVLQVLELLRSAAWLTFLLWVLGYRLEAREGDKGGIPPWAWALYLIIALLLGAVAAHPLSFADPEGLSGLGQLVLLGFVLVPVAGLVLVEQLFRNTDPGSRWTVKFLCFGVGSMLAYDFYLYADALLFRRIDPALWSVRGFINAMVVPLIGVAVRRNQTWSVELFASKRIVFHSAALLGAGLYLLFMAAAGYYVRTFGGSWGVALQAVFLFGAAVVLLVLLFSGQVRANLKFFLNRHFFHYKYDYREEWLRFIGALSSVEESGALKQTVVKAIADIVESPGGVLWLRDGPMAFRPVARLGMPEPEAEREPADGSLVRFLTEREWIVEVPAWEREPELYAGLQLPDWLQRLPRAWLVVPLFHLDDLYGFVVLARSRGHFQFNWEDIDLLKTVGRQASGYLALMAVTEALADSRQFDAFNRLSAYVVHDLKNLVAQLSLVVSNARKHMHNPEFVQDAVDTVENAVTRMNRLLEQLRKDRGQAGRQQRVALDEALVEVVRQRAGGLPRPVLDAAGGPTVLADRERLVRVVGHLVQNAQEATPDDGAIHLRLKRSGPLAVIEVQDTGIGMASEFIRSELFKPFVTTKGNAGMGIGVYEVREFARSAGGDVDVESTPGAGTTFRISLPVEDAADPLPQTAIPTQEHRGQEQA